MFRELRHIKFARGFKPDNAGKTIFTNDAPFPLIQRLVIAIFSLSFIVTLAIMIEKELGNGHHPAGAVWRIILYMIMAVWTLIAFLALFGIEPFRSKRRKAKR